MEYVFSVSLSTITGDDWSNLRAEICIRFLGGPMGTSTFAVFGINDCRLKGQRCAAASGGGFPANISNSDFTYK